MSPDKKDRPPAVAGTTFKLETACNDLFATVNGWNGESDLEMFLKCGPQGSCSAAITNALAILFSIARRCQVPLLPIAKLFSRHGGLCNKAISSGTSTCINSLGELLLELAATEDDAEEVGTPVKMEGSFRVRFTGCGPIMVSCGNDSNCLRYVHAQLAKTNTCANTITSILSELVSLMLAFGVESEKIIKAIRGISCPSARHDNSSCLDAIGRAISDHVQPPDLSEAENGMVEEQ